ISTIDCWAKRPSGLAPAVCVTPSARGPEGRFVVMKQLPLFPELINSKQCSTCGAVKSLAEYHKNPHTRDGYYVACKTCCAEYQREYRLKHKEERREKKRQYRENNREAVIARKKAYYKSNQRKIVRRVVQWQKDNPDKVRTKSKLRR